MGLLSRVLPHSPGTRPEAVHLYRQGIAELEQGIAVDCSGRGEDRRRAQRLQTKMETNLAVASDRLRFLGQSLLAAEEWDSRTETKMF